MARQAKSASASIESLAEAFLMLGILSGISAFALFIYFEFSIIYLLGLISVIVGFGLPTCLLFLWAKAVRESEKTNQYLALLVDQATQGKVTP